MVHLSANFHQEHFYSLQVLQEAIRAYYVSTGVHVSVIDGKGDTIYSCGKGAGLCSFLKAHTKRFHNCAEEHLRASRIAERLGEEYIFACPTGLIHFIAPIIHDNMFQWALIAGPMLMNAPDNLMVEEIMANNQLPVGKRKQISSYLQEISVVEPKTVRYLSKLLFLVSCNFMPQDRYILQEHSEQSSQQSAIGECIQQLKENIHAESYYPYEREKELLIKVKNGDVIGAKAILNELLGHIFFHTGGNLEITKARILELCALLSRAAVEGGAALDIIFGMNDGFIKELIQKTSLEDLSFWLLKVLNRFMEKIFYIPDSRNAEIIRAALNYINKNYSQSITLDSVSHAVHLNASYFSALLKKEIGVGFSDYLNKVRIEESKPLLKNRRYSILDVAIEAGFENQSYYSKVFKRLVGITPKQFRLMQK